MTLRRTFTTAVLTSASLMCGCAQSNLVPAPLKAAFAQSARRMDGPNAPETRERTPRQNAFAMARLCEQRGEMDAARKLYAKCIAEEPNNPSALHRLGVLAAGEGKLDDALTNFEQALAMAPPTTELLSDLGYCHYLMNDLQSAEQILRDGLAREPNSQAICNNLALVCSETGRFDEALSLFKRVNTEAEAYSNIAYAYSQAGDLEKSKEYYSQALSINEDLRVAAEAMLQVAQRQSQFQQPDPAQPSDAMFVQAEPSEPIPAGESIPTAEVYDWQRQQDNTVRLASQDAPASAQPEVVIEDGPLRWRSPDGKPTASVGFVGVPVDTAKMAPEQVQSEQKSFLHQRPGTTIRDDNVRPISAEFPVAQDVRFEGIQTAVYEYPESATPYATHIQQAAYAAPVEPGLLPQTGDSPQPLPPTHAQPLPAQPAPGRLGVLDFPFVPKRK